MQQSLHYSMPIVQYVHMYSPDSRPEVDSQGYSAVKILKNSRDGTARLVRVLDLAVLRGQLRSGTPR